MLRVGHSQSKYSSRWLENLQTSVKNASASLNAFATDHDSTLSDYSNFRTDTAAKLKEDKDRLIQLQDEMQRLKEQMEHLSEGFAYGYYTYLLEENERKAIALGALVELQEGLVAGLEIPTEEVLEKLYVLRLGSTSYAERLQLELSAWPEFTQYRLDPEVLQRYLILRRNRRHLAKQLGALLRARYKFFRRDLRLSLRSIIRFLFKNMDDESDARIDFSIVSTQHCELKSLRNGYVHYKKTNKRNPRYQYASYGAAA